MENNDSNNYSNNYSNSNSNIPSNNNFNSPQNVVLRPIGFYYTTFTISPTFVDRLLSLNDLGNNQQNNFGNSNFNYDYNNEENSPYSNPNIDNMSFNFSNFSTYSNNSNNNNNSNNSNNNYEISNDISSVFFPTVNLIERLFNDYLENKNKLNDEEYKINIEKIDKKLDECPICFSDSETTIKIKKCQHIFCEDCIEKWLKNHKNTCPICRVNVIENENNNLEQNNNENNNNDNNDNNENN